MLDRYLNKHFGFQKIEEDEFGVIYKKPVTEFGYTQIVHISHKRSGKHLIQSYDPALFDDKKIGNACVALQISEMLSLWLKAKWMAHKYHWNRRKKA